MWSLELQSRQKRDSLYSSSWPREILPRGERVACLPRRLPVVLELPAFRVGGDGRAPEFTELKRGRWAAAGVEWARLAELTGCDKQ